MIKKIDLLSTKDTKELIYQELMFIILNNNK